MSTVRKGTSVEVNPQSVKDGHKYFRNLQVKSNDLEHGRGTKEVFRL